MDWGREYTVVYNTTVSQSLCGYPHGYTQTHTCASCLCMCVLNMQVHIFRFSLSTQMLINNLIIPEQSFFKIDHMVIADPEGQLQTLKQLRSSGKIKIHRHSSVITLLLSDWLTIRREVPQPNNKEEKAFHEKTTFPLTVWIYAPRQSCISPLFHPGTSTISIQVQNRRHGAHSLLHKWQITSGLIIKNQRGPKGVVMETGRGRGAGEPNKACWVSGDKEGHISPHADDPKKVHSITNGCQVEATKVTSTWVAWTVLLLCDLAQMCIKEN